MQSDSSGGEVAMHFDVRFKFGDSHNVVVRNHCHKGQWANEERHANHFPFAHDANFDMVIHVEQHCYKVSGRRGTLLPPILVPPGVKQRCDGVEN